MEKNSLTPVSMSKNINKLIKNSKLKIIKKAGHLTNIENPEEFNKLFLIFLKYDVINNINFMVLK